MGDARYTNDLSLDGVGTWDELATAIRQVHLRADRPSLRILEARTRHSTTPLSKTALAEMLNGARFPRKAMLLSFLGACGVQGAAVDPWQRAWERAAAAMERKGTRRVTGMWSFSDSGPVRLICAQLPANEAGDLADTENPNYAELLSYADLDSLLDLYTHIRVENPAMDVFFKSSSQFIPDDLLGHVVLIGGIAYNELTERILEISHLPIKQVADPEVRTGEIFVVDHDGDEERFLPHFSPDGHGLMEDVGMIARTPNPLNSNRILTICNGIHSRGVLGSVRTFTDPRLRESNERYIDENFADPSTFAILMRVQVIGGRTLTPDFNAADSILYRWPPGPGDAGQL